MSKKNEKLEIKNLSVNVKLYKKYQKINIKYNLNKNSWSKEKKI